MKRLIVLAALASTPALAQQPTMQQQLDAGLAQIAAIGASMRGQIMQDQAQIAALTKENADLVKQRDAAKATDGKPPEPAK